jgi:hypothetical protein
VTTKVDILRALKDERIKWRQSEKPKAPLTVSDETGSGVRREYK